VAEGAPLFLYPGDLEVSRGAERTVQFSRALAERLPGLRIVIAYRDKTPRAAQRAKELEALVDRSVVRFECNVPDIHALVKASTAVLFPVDDLYGKVDLPIVLLEAFRLGTPVLALDQGPLSSLEGALLLGEGDDEWISAAVASARDTDFRAELVEKALGAIESHYRPSRVSEAYEALYRELLEPPRTC
jgi:phosphatidylinositol alpha-1,6-mannosyltransferase